MSGQENKALKMHSGPVRIKESLNEITEKNLSKIIADFPQSEGKYVLNAS